VVLPLTTNQIGYGIEIASLLRQAGIATLHYTEPNGVKAKFRYANRMGYRYALVLGESEAEGETVSVKNMSTGENTVVNKEEVVDFLREDMEVKSE
jgi:histidyl-tRNA synthetase